jgi:hypothetical protein
MGNSLTSDPNLLARAAARSSSAVMGFGGPILCDPGFWGRVLEVVLEGPVGAAGDSASLAVAAVGGGTEAVDRVARGPAGG